ncbi:MAG: VWA domain-containing protein [Planctomycetota bacterium]|nr:MAG: VWA domain-containing protein [Planctomycetota bacterium]
MNGSSLHDPWLLLAALPFLLLELWRRRHPRDATILFPTLGNVPSTPSLRVLLLPLPRVLFGLGIVALALALARPRQGEARSVVRREGIGISMVLDRSGSMEEEMPYAGRSLPKIDIVKDIFARFVRGDGELPGRQTDLLGLVTFARFPEEACPLVTRYEPLLAAVQNLRTVPPFLTAQRVPTRDRREARAANPLSATAIGEGILRGVLTLVAAEDDLRARRGAAQDRAGADTAKEGYALRGKALILLTDGQNNAGRSPLEAAQRAAENGVRIYYVLLMSRDVRQETFFGPSVVHHLSDAEVEAIMEEPRAIAERTGGRAFFAEDGDALKRIYAEIDSLERVDVGEIEYTSYRELYSLPLLLGIALVLVSSFLEETVLRRSP